MDKLKSYLSALCCCLLISGTALAEKIDDEPVAAKSVEAKSVEALVQAQGETRRKQIVDDAVDALARTRAALEALENNDTEAALEGLAVSIGKLELLMARDPALALAPTGIAMATRDLSGAKGAVHEIIRDAERLLADGQIQAARMLLDGVASELVISTTSLPLGTYPEAIKAITPLIDEGKTDEARKALLAVLNTLVVTHEIIPLPVIRAEAMLSVAESLAGEEERTEEQEVTMKQAVSAVKEQLELAELLGYGKKANYEPFYQQLDGLDSKLNHDESDPGFFNRVRESLSAIWQS